MQDLIQFFISHWFLSVLLILLIALLLIEEARTKGLMNKINPQRVVEMLNRDNAIVIDIRPREAFQSGHIVGAVNISQVDLEKDPAKIKKYEKQPIVLVCENGQKSAVVAASLKKQNIEQVHVLNGGMQAWKSAQLPLVKK